MFKSLRSKLALCVAGVVGAVSSALAALPDGVATGFTAIQTDGLALLDLAWPVVIAFTVGFIYFRLFKKGSRQIG